MPKRQNLSPLHKDKKKKKVDDDSDEKPHIKSVLESALVSACIANPDLPLDQFLGSSLANLKGLGVDNAEEIEKLLSKLYSEVQEQTKNSSNKKGKNISTTNSKPTTTTTTSSSSSSSSLKKSNRIARAGCVLVSDCIKVHTAIHQYPATKSVAISTGEVIEISVSSNKCRKAVINGCSFMEQNTAKSSTFARKAKQGHKITWALYQKKWGMLCDGRVEIDCALFDHDEFDEAERVDVPTETVDQLLKATSPPEEPSSSHLVSLSIEFPTYWEAKGTQSMCRAEVPEPSDEFKKLANMFIKTSEQKVEVIKITRLHNPTLWMRYFLKRQNIIEGNDSTPEKISHVLTNSLQKESNEYYFFHGCNPAVVEKIIATGFDERLGSLDGLFGSGVYFAENSAKSLNYTHAQGCEQIGAVYSASKCTCRGSKLPRMLFISRVVLGTPWVRLVSTDRSNPMRRPPERPNGILYDSVMGELPWGRQPNVFVPQVHDQKS